MVYVEGPVDTAGEVPMPSWGFSGLSPIAMAFLGVLSYSEVLSVQEKTRSQS